MSLTTCIGKFSKSLTQEDRQAIVDRADELHRSGVPLAEAGQTAVSDRIAFVEGLIEAGRAKEPELPDNARPDPTRADEMDDDSAEWERRLETLFVNPEQTVRAAEVAKDGPVLTPAEADAKLEEWRRAAQNPKDAGKNSGITVLSLFDYTGVWSAPWVEAGYNVIQIDIKNGQDINDIGIEWLNDNGIDDVDVVLAAVPCTDFAASGARWWQDKDGDGRTEASLDLLHQTKAILEYFRPRVWAIENPVGRIQRIGKLNEPRLIFDPHHYGDPYTKKTLLYGNFNPNLPQANVEPTEGSKIAKLSSGAKAEREVTPEGFAYAFFMANGQDFGPVDAVSEQQAAQAKREDTTDADREAERVEAAARAERAAAREAERTIYRELSQDPGLVGKPAEVRARVVAMLGDTNLPQAKVDILVRAIIKTLTKNAAELAKQQHRLPEVRAAAIAAAVTSAYPDAEITPQRHAAFIGGFDHALSGKTKSTLTGEDLADRQRGYEAGRKWMKTVEGSAWYEGRPVSKLKNTGADLRRWWEQMQEQMKGNESDIDKAWKQIESATARADFFAPLMPEDATPGFKVYVQAVRKDVTPFKEWLVGRHVYNGAYLGRHGGRRRSRYSDSRSPIELIVAGESYPNTLSQEDATKFQEDESFRAEWLREQARDYAKAVREFIDFLVGASSVKEAADRFTERYVTKNPPPPDHWGGELNAAGGDLWLGKQATGGRDAAIWGGSKNELLQLRSQSRWTLDLVKNEADVKLPDRATPLTAPRLDRVTRTGKDLRGGLNVTPDEVKAKFGFADVGFGSYVASKDDQDHLNYGHDAFADLAQHFGVPARGVGFGGQLHFTIGALGHGKFAATFHPGHPGPNGTTVQVINLTNTKGDGAVYHEWVHALDHFLGGEWKDKVRPLLLRYLTRKTDTVESVEDRARDFLFGGWYFKGDKKADKVDAAVRGLRHHARPTTAYKVNADLLGKDYWGNEKELIARAGEAWATDTLGFVNDYLTNPEWNGDGKVTKANGYRGTPYPTGDERKLFNEVYTALSKAVKWSADGKPTVTFKDFKAALPSHLFDGERRREELSDPKAMQAFYVEEQAKRADEEARKAQEKLDEAEREQAELDRLAAEKLKQMAPPPATVDEPPPSETSGPLSDDELEAIFNQAAAELTETEAENPDTPEPGTPPEDTPPAPASFTGWPAADIAEILANASDPNYVAIAGDDIPGVPTIHEVGRMGKTDHVGFGTFTTKGQDIAGQAWELNWDGGGAMQRTTGGKAWTNVYATGRHPFPAGVRRRLEIALERKKAEELLAGGRGAKLPETPTPTPTPAPEPAADKTATQLISEASKLGVKGVDEAMTALAKLFGGTPGRLNSFPAGFDEETYKAAKPHFEASLKAFQEAGKTLKDLFQLLIKQFGLGIKEYGLRFAKDMELTAQLGTKPSASMAVARQVQMMLGRGLAFDWRALFEEADAAWGGTQAEGKYTPKDAYDAMEAGVNLYLMSGQQAATFNPNASREDAINAIGALRKMMTLLPTQTKRTAEQDQMQQFSTVPPLAYAANWVANVTADDTVLESSAGLGGLALFARNAGAKLVLNELSSRRAAVLQELFPGARVSREDGEQIHNILPDDITPTVAIINPPFSAGVGGVKNTKVGARHLEQALERLPDGGRLVAIVGEGMARDKPAFRDWWKKMEGLYYVRAAVPMDGAGYAKYGTTFDNVLIVIDKVKAPKGAESPVTERVTDYTDLIRLLAEVRNDRRPAKAVVSDAETTERNNAESEHDDAAADEQRPGEPGTVDSEGGAGVGAGEPGGGSGVGRGRRGRGGASRSGKSKGGLRAPGDTDTGVGDDAAGGGGGVAGEGGGSDAAGGGTGLTIENEDIQAGALTDSVFEHYTPQRLQVPGAKPHPGALVQSAAMASVLPPAATYTPNLPKETIEGGLLSIAQIEAVVYAGQAHEQLLEAEVDAASAVNVYHDTKLAELAGTKYRRGFFIGDGTGVGKGREISGVIIDNMRQGRKKHVWVSQNPGLIRDAQRDFKGAGGDPSKIVALKDAAKTTEHIRIADGVIFVPYRTLISKATTASFSPGAAVEVGRAIDLGDGKDRDVGALVRINPKGSRVMVSYQRKGSKTPTVISHQYAQILSIDGRADWMQVAAGALSRVDQLVAWLGHDFDGVIAFDEAHNAGNAISIKGERGPSKPSEQAQAVIELQARLPNARVLYVSATGATEVSNLAFANRLGLWGSGTAFQTVRDFINAMSAGGLATMELVARDMKQVGVYMARSLSFDGVTYSRLEHELSPLQTDIYNRLCDAWQVTLQNMEAALEVIGAKGQDGTTKSKDAKKNMKSAYWGAQQRFFNQIITSMQMPTVIEAVERDIADGKAVAMQFVNTGAAPMDRALAKAAKKAADDEDADALEDLDLTPRDQLLEMVQKAFPVIQYRDERDSEGNRITVPVRDSNGNFVENKQAVAMRDKLLEDLKAIRVPDGPLDMIVNHFGPEAVAEVTGRSRRVVRRPDKSGNVVTKVESRSAAATRVDTDAFMGDKKRIIVFSNAGGTGFSFHADLTAKNQRKRSHYLIQPGWSANKAVQGLGRTHRTNQASAPHYTLASTNIPAHKRFLSSIARRLDQLGALTKGQRDTSSGGLFSEKDNLESQYATEAVRRLITDVKAGQVSGLEFADFMRQLGLEDIVNAQTGQIAENKWPPTSQFLNRMLSLRLDTQEVAFAAFIGRMEEQIDLAAQRGQLDTGMQTIRALESRVVNEDVVYTDPRTGAETRLIDLELTQATHIHSFPTKWALDGDGKATWLVNNKSGRVYARVLSGTHTTKAGVVEDRFRMLGTGGTQIKYASDFADKKAYKRIDETEAREIWETENATRAPTYTEQKSMLVGAMLPIWDRLPQQFRIQVARTQTVDGRRLLGRIIHEDDIADLRKNLNVDAPESKLPAKDVIARILKGDVGELANGWTLERARVSDDLRVEIKSNKGDNYMPDATARDLVAHGVIQERIGWNDRYFIPVNGPGALEWILKSKPLVALQPRDKKGPQDSADFSQATTPFYSALERHINGATMKAGTAEAWKALLKEGVNKGKVKATEIEWSGIEQFLDLQAGGKVTREQVSAFLADNGVRVDETVLGEKTLAEWEDAERARLAASNMDRLRDEAQNFEADATREQLIDEAVEIARGYYEANEDDRHKIDGGAKFGQYQLPGGTNYREILLTLPHRAEAGEELIYNADGEVIGSAPVNGHRIVGKVRTPYRSQHWDQPNVLAHIRVNDREALRPGVDMAEIERRIVAAVGAKKGGDLGNGAPGAAARKGAITEQEARWYSHHRGFLNVPTESPMQRVLFVEEIQSDWAQEGKKHGFKAPESADPKIEVRLVGSWHSQFPDMKDKWRVTVDGRDRGYIQAQDENEARYKANANEQNERDNSSKVPQAPFVTKTDAWVALAIKRVIALAANEGYDRVAFVTGEQSAQRYDLSKSLDAIRWDGREDTKYIVLVGLKGISDQDLEISASASTGIIGTMDAGAPETWRGKHLSDVVGKEVADKILGSPKGELTGEGLKVGGEGMRAFYDKIVPSVAKDVLRKVGGNALGTVAFTPERQFVVRPEGEADGRWLIDEVYADGTVVAYAVSRTEAKAREVAAAQNAKIAEKAGPVSQPGFDITPAMREQAAKGLPLFTQRVPNTRGEILAAKAALARIEAAGGVTSPDDLRDLLRVSGYSQWAESPIVGDVDAARRLWDDIEAEFPVDGRPVLNQQGVLSIKAISARDAGRVKAVAELADRYGKVPVIVRGRREDLDDGAMRAAGFEPYRGIQEIAGRAMQWPEVGISWIRPGGKISAVTPLFTRTPAGWETAETVSEPSTVESAKAEIEALFGKGAVDKVVTVVQTVDDLPERIAGLMREAGAIAVTINKSRVYIVADRLSRGTAQAVVVHELGVHVGMDKDDVLALTQQVFKWTERKDRLGDMARQAVAGAAQSKSTHRDEETLAYMTQFLVDSGVTPTSPESAGGKFLAWIARMLKAAARRLRLTREFSERDLVDFAFGAAKMALRRAPARASDGQQFADASVQFAQSPGALARAARERAADILNTDTSLNRWNEWMGFPYAIAHAKNADGSLKRPDYKVVYDEVQDYLTDINTFANDPGELAPDVVPQLNSWRDVLPKLFGGTGRPLRLAEKDREPVSRAIYEGTLNYTRDRWGDPVPVGPDDVPGVVWSDAELRDMWDLNPRQIDLYKQTRASIDRSLDLLVAAEVARHMGDDLPRAIKALVSRGDVGRFKGLVATALVRAVSAARSDLRAQKSNAKLIAPSNPQQAALAQKRIERAQDEVVRLVKLQKDVDGKYAKIARLKVHGYFPLMRFGSWTLTVKDQAGKVEFFGLYETRAERNVAERAFRNSPAFSNSVIETGELSKEKFRLYQGINPETLALFGDSAGVGMDARDLMAQWIQKAKNNHSALKRLLRRKGTAGYSEDVQRTLAQFLVSNARAASSNLHAGEMDKAANAIDEKRGRLKDEAVDLVKYVQDPTDGKVVQGIKGVMFHNFIGGSIMSAVTNLTQTPVQTFPYIASRSNEATAARLVGLAMKDALIKVDQNTPLGKAIKQAEEDGTISPQALHELQGQGLKAGFGSVESMLRALGISTTAVAVTEGSIRKVLFAWGGLFALAEQYNRRVAFIAAYRLALEKGAADPMAFAEEAVKETQNVYNRGNRPKAARNSVGNVVMTYSQFKVNYIEFLLRLPPRYRALSLAVLVLMAGLAGLPFMDDADDLLDTIMQRMFGKAWSTKLEKTKLLTAIFNREAAEYLLHGVTAGAGFPIDLAGRMSLANMVPATGLGLVANEGKPREALEALGPLGGVVRDAAIKGEIRPVAIRNLAAGIEAFRTGELRDANGKLIAKVNKAEAAAKMIGANPGVAARQSRDRNLVQPIIDQQRAVESKIVRKVAAGIVELTAAGEDTAAKQQAKKNIADAAADLREWNRKNPEWEIAITDEQIERAVLSMKTERPDRFLKTIPVELRKTVKDWVAP